MCLFIRLQVLADTYVMCHSNEIINRIWEKMPWGKILASLKINGKTPTAHQWDKDFNVYVRIEIEFNFSTCEWEVLLCDYFIGFNSLLFLQAKLLLKTLVSGNQWEFFPRTFCQHCTIYSLLFFIFCPLYSSSYGRAREIGSFLELGKMKKINKPRKRSKD